MVRTNPLLVFVALSLSLSPAWAQSDSDQKTESDKEEASSSSTQESKGDRDGEATQEAEAENAPKGPGRTSRTGSLPRGITVFAPAPGLPSGARLAPGGAIVLRSGDAVTEAEKPEGITLLGEQQSDEDRPFVRVSSSSAVEDLADLAPIPKLPEGMVPADPDAPDAPEQAPSRRERKLVGPSIDEQVGVFGGDLQTGGQPLIDRIGWEPTDALEPRDPKVPYPWNPAEWSPPIIDPTWKPNEAYARDEANPYPWNRSIWATQTFNPTWIPTDSWGRSTPAGGFVNTTTPGAGEAIDLDDLAAEIARRIAEQQQPDSKSPTNDSTAPASESSSSSDAPQN